MIRRMACALGALVACAGWTTSPDGLSARTGGPDGPYVELSCAGPGRLRIEAYPAAGGAELGFLRDGSGLTLGMSVAGDRLTTEIPFGGGEPWTGEGIAEDGRVAIGKGVEAPTLPWNGAGPIIAGIARGCGEPV